jgi:hypothetical protein
MFNKIRNQLMVLDDDPLSGDVEAEGVPSSAEELALG